MRWLAVAAIALLTLSGCGSYALAFTPTGSLPPYADTVGVWANEETTLTLDDDRGFEIVDLPAGVINREGSFSGTVEEHTGPESGLDAYDLFDSAGTYIDTLYYYDGAFEEPVFLFARGVVDDGDWMRFAKQPKASR